jgi:predicted RNA-binding protein with PUA-like domain
MARRYWLFKSEPSAFSLDDLKRSPGGVAPWDGVRNYQARNLLRDEIQVGDGVLFYHSSTDPTGVVGIAEVVKAGYPDHTAWDPESDHPDPRSTPENPRWYMVDVRYVRHLPRTVTLAEIKAAPALKDMMVARRGARLSVQPVTQKEWAAVLKLAERGQAAIGESAPGR